jgi:hypothetical protein
MRLSCRLFGGEELHAQFVGAQSELAKDPFAVSLLILGLALVGVFLVSLRQGCLISAEAVA